MRPRVPLFPIDSHPGYDWGEDRIERLIDLAHSAGDFDGRAVNTERGQRHAGRLSDKTSQHDDIETNDDGVKQIVSADRRGVIEQSA